MPRRVVLAVALLCSWIGLAVADDPASAPPQPTTLAGRVIDIHGKPVPAARVHVLPRGGARVQTETNADGRYAVELGGGGAYSVVIAVKNVNTYRQVLVAEHATTPLDVLVEIDVDGGEVIKITEERVPQPAIQATPMNPDSRKSLPYSKQAMERDAWARAWLLLDIDETGAVTRLKMLKRPGFDLDQIAIDEAFKLRFEPARDADGKPTRTWLLWDMEWPSAGWLRQNVGTIAGRPLATDDLYARRRTTSNRGANDGTMVNPALGTKPGVIRGDVVADDRPAGGGRSNRRQDARGTTPRAITGTLVAPGQGTLPTSSQVPMDRVPCADQDPLDLDKSNRALRDCSRPDLSNLDQLPWITRENAKTALADLAATQVQTIPRKRGSRIPELISGGVAVAAAGALVYSFVKYNSLNSDLRPTTDGNVVTGRMNDLAFWNRAMLGTAALTAAATITTAVLRGRHKGRDSFTVQPTRGGGALSWGREF